MSKIELLAPAKDRDCGKAAIDCGADAVYIGAPAFGARSAVGNTLDDIAALVEYAHRYWASVYIPINTVLYDHEIDDAVQMIHELYRINVDGIILQDVGLLECDLPPIPLHASTQMHNESPDKVTFLEQIGIQRVILARELELSRIKEIKAATHVELEVFVHGAICVSYSGRCYMSYAQGGRSANRGACAQPCRKPYRLIDGDGTTIARNKHLLSTRDLNLSENLDELVEAGVTSFKIEGRLKERDYVTNVVTHYRQKLDEILKGRGLQKASHGTSKADFTPDLDKTFQRGYSTYFLHGRDHLINTMNSPKMTGEKLGVVRSKDATSFVVETAVAVHRGDGLCYYDEKGILQGALVNDVQPEKAGLISLGRVPKREKSQVTGERPLVGGPQRLRITPARMNGVVVGADVYRNHDHDFLETLKKIRVERRIEVSLHLTETTCGVQVTARDEAGVTATCDFACDKVPAEKPEQAEGNIRRQLMKSGDTEFNVTDVTIDLPRPLFFPMSVLNALRREALEELARQRATQRPRFDAPILPNDVPYPEKDLTFEANVLNEKAVAFYKRHGVGTIEPAAESGLDLRGKRVMTTRYCVKYELGACKRYKSDAIKLVEPLQMVDDAGERLDLRFDCRNCRMEVWLPSA